MGTVFLRSLTTTVKVSTNFESKQSFKMAVRFLLLVSLAVLASVDFVSADGDNFWGANCGALMGGSDKCLKPISYCDRNVKSVAKQVAKKVSNTGSLLYGECRPIWWFWVLIVLGIVLVLGSILCSCLMCAFCPFYHLGDASDQAREFEHFNR